MNTGKHHIRKQILDFQFSSKSSAMEWQRNVSFRYQRLFEKAIASVLDMYDDNLEYSIERLEIDLGSITESELIAKTEAALRKILEKGFQKQPSSLRANSGAAVYGESEIVSSQQARDGLFKSFTFFLKSGFLPWNTSVVTITDLEKEIGEKWPEPLLTEQLKVHQILHNKWARQRLYYQFSKPFAKKILRRYFQEDLKSLRSLQKIFLRSFQQSFSHLKHAAIDFEPKSETRLIQWIALESPIAINTWEAEFFKSGVELFLAKTANKQGVKKLKKITIPRLNGRTENEIETVIMRVAEQLKVHKPNKERRDKQRKPEATKEVVTAQGVNPETPYGPGNGKPNKPGETNTVSARREIQIPADKHKGKTSTEGIKTGQSIRKTDANPANENNLGSKEKKANRGKQGKRAVHELFEMNSKVPETKDDTSDFFGKEQHNSLSFQEAFYVQHGGLVLCWPYLLHLFKKLGYVKDKEFVSKNEKERAVSLLGYIASGNKINTEPHLVLAKFLCNWPIQMPIRKDLKLTKQEVEEAKTMLKSLIANWKILKKTSVEGLRETFFERAGRLQNEEEHWKLTVEQKGTDILLGHLPYGISIIKLPWLQDLLMVDWT